MPETGHASSGSLPLPKDVDVQICLLGGLGTAAYYTNQIERHLSTIDSSFLEINYFWENALNMYFATWPGPNGE
jgi:hypothetical protein